MQYDYLSGMGFDVHALEPLNQESFIMIGGVAISAKHKVIAHSDGDVALHALVDAMLGAIGAGDIGEHFPPTDMRWKDANSSAFVLHALSLCAEKNAQLVNIDITLICENPKINPYKAAIRSHVATLLSLSPERVNVKATTTEKLGFLGRCEGIAAQAIVSIKIPAS